MKTKAQEYWKRNLILLVAGIIHFILYHLLYFYKPRAK